MPRYCFTNEYSDTIERYFRMSDDIPVEVVVETDGASCAGSRTFKRDYGAETKSVQTESSPGWPMAPCNSSGVMPEQAQELRDHFTKSGVPTEVTPMGDPVYRSPAHQKRALACRGMHNKAAI